MKNHSIKAVVLLLSICAVISCSKEKVMEQTAASTPQELTKKGTTEKVFVYQEQDYLILFDNNGDYIPTAASDALQRAIATAADLTAFSFSSKGENKTHLFDSEMEGYKYGETHIDQRSGRQLQVGHATNLLRDQLIQKYGSPPIDYTNPIIKAEAEAGVAAIYAAYHIAGSPPKNVVDFMGTLGNKTTKSTNNNSWQLWEHPIQNGEVFDMETEPNV